LTKDPDSSLVLADFGIAKMLDSPGEVLTSMAGSFGYAAPEVMLRQGHGKAVDMWSLGVITYTLLCGYSPFRSENLNDLVDECKSGRIVFHERYWRDVSSDAKDFSLCLLQPDPKKRATSQEAMKHIWLKGETASDHDLIPEMKKYLAKARLRRGIEIIKLANRIEALKMQQNAEDDDIGLEDLPTEDAGQALADTPPEVLATGERKPRKSLSKVAKGAIFREVVLAKVREMKEQQEQEKMQRTLTEQARERRKSSNHG
jgi:calcium/calmodulin-dependent protein kinase I